MLHVPSKLGPFELLHRLGAGGMAETFVAVRRGPGGFEQRACVKRILPAYAEDRDFVGSFLAEARTSAALRHANVVQVLDFGREEADGSYYLALELVDGLDLRALLTRGAQLDAEQVCLVAADLAAALEHAHAVDEGHAQVIHRDLSPSNVLVSRAGEVKLTDFGIARAVGSAHRTATGVIKGKVPYMPPEYIEHGRFDPRGDLFALGVMLFELLHGERPFDGDSELDTMRRIAAGDRLPFTASAPPALVDCIERLLATRPEERPESATALLDALPPLPAHQVRRRLAELVRARSSAPRLTPPPRDAEAPRGTTLPLAPPLEALAVPATRTAPRPVALTPSKKALLTLLGSVIVLIGVGTAALLRDDHRAAASPPPRVPSLPGSGVLGVHQPASSAPGTSAAPASTGTTATIPASAVATTAGGAGPAALDGVAAQDRAPALPASAPPSPTLGSAAPQGGNAPAQATSPDVAPRPLPSAEPASTGMTATPSGGTPSTTAASGGPTSASPPTPKLAELRVIVYPFGEIWVDDKYIGHSPRTLQLKPGAHQIAVGEGRASERHAVQLEPGEKQQVLLQLPRRPR